MDRSALYHDGNRRLQDEFDSRRIADRLEAVNLRTAFSDRDRQFIESACFFFLATADRADSRTSRTRAACPASCASSDRPSWPIPTMTETACS